MCAQRSTEKIRTSVDDSFESFPYVFMIKGFDCTDHM